ncbi:MAG: NAD(P)-dependent oxidoreductase, partial [Emcibacteraceae bacterium]|nr:NAD(P)-dependent oxidoreductase [Emcibacteraceae bacterium]
MNMTKVAFLGLGVMGFPMAGHLSEAGHEVVVYNRTAAKSEQWIKKYSGSMELTPAKAANGADVVFACVGNDADLRSVVLGDDGAFAGMADGATFVDHTTTSANISRELDEIAKKQGFSFIDAPVSGGQAGAENAILTVMCGGEEINYNK